MEATGLTRDDFSIALGITPAMLERNLRTDRPLSGSSYEAAWGLIELINTFEMLNPDEEEPERHVGTWLQTHNAVLHGAAPLTFMATEGARAKVTQVANLQFRH